MMRGGNIFSRGPVCLYLSALSLKPPTSPNSSLRVQILIPRKQSKQRTLPAIVAKWNCN